MLWLFLDDINLNTHITLNSEQSRHIIKSLRMKVGEELTLCDTSSTQYESVISQIDATCNHVEVEVKNRFKCENEPTVNITLFQSLTKGDKMDYTIQKAVELGVHKIVPIITNRCVSRPTEKALLKKEERWQKIALGASCQSRRGIVPKVTKTLQFVKTLEKLHDYDKVIVFYEGGGDSVSNIIDSSCKNIAIFIGSEGGFEENEIAQLENVGAVCATLGKRILRAETAPIVALSILMYETDNFS